MKHTLPKTQWPWFALTVSSKVKCYEINWISKYDILCRYIIQTLIIRCIIYEIQTISHKYNKRPLGLTAPLSNNTLSMIHSPMNTQWPFYATQGQCHGVNWKTIPYICMYKSRYLSLNMIPHRQLIWYMGSRLQEPYDFWHQAEKQNGLWWPFCI